MSQAEKNPVGYLRRACIIKPGKQGKMGDQITLHNDVSETQWNQLVMSGNLLKKKPTGTDKDNSLEFAEQTTRKRKRTPKPAEPVADSIPEGD